MSAHNSENSDDDVGDSVTLISRLDISDPLHLHPNDTTTLTVVSMKLKGTGYYQVWSCAILLALEGYNKIGFIDGSCKRSKIDDILGKQRDRINTLKQNGSSIADYYHKLNALWKQYDAMIQLPKCVCNDYDGFKKHNRLLKLMQFLIGLDDSYMQIRSSILSREVLPDVRSTYATISSEESHRVARNNQNFNARPSRSNNLNNNRQGGGSGVNNNRQGGGSDLVCEECGFNGHTINRCFKIIGYPPDFGKKKFGKNVKKQGVSNNNSASSSSSSGFTDEQMATLISLIKDNKFGKNVQANIVRVNQHITYTDKELENVVDISHLKIKVGYPNGTEAFISNIRNLKLSNGLVLYDVMVNPYCFTLISVHKMAKENKIIVAFDENRLGHPAEFLMSKQTRETFPLSDHKSGFLGELVHLDLWGPYKVSSSEGLVSRRVIGYTVLTSIGSFFQDSDKVKNDSESVNVFQDVNHINFFDLEYPELPYDDESVDPVRNCNNKSQSASSSSSESSRNSFTAVNSGIDENNSVFTTQDEVVTTLEENIFAEGNLD
ncbi:ribonuclease H-like domain-containing protein [Tanacetum coccineum]